MSSPPVLEPPELPEINSDPQQALLALVQQLKDGQSEQTALIQKLNKTVLTSRTLINELITAQTDMKEELAKLRSSNVSGECQVCNNKRDAAVAMSAVASVGQTTDDLIATLIEGRTRKNQWPVKTNAVTCFTKDADLTKIRLHHSNRYQHIPIRIPKTEKNKDGTKPCKLCSEGKIRRKTTWMCAVCEAPLCTKPLVGEDSSAPTHFALWHSEKDLIPTHKRCFGELKGGRESRKKAKLETEADVSLGMDV
ncbi:hypothetical protein QTG54_003862 [Skeletonema marinoi]|uniref:PiggyBac transposable element-derived protein 4 C-terminal zinc-ribbon domain-containing protein n=1 Tax=Skeletonema marinoi TaxID=267567 RepID=A0AAD8YH71_9STRA|nr:hypothetical protein QTG54_003862 [Skeletonema marinoi]